MAGKETRPAPTTSAAAAKVAHAAPPQQQQQKQGAVQTSSFPSQPRKDQGQDPTTVKPGDAPKQRPEKQKQGATQASSQSQRPRKNQGQGRQAASRAAVAGPKPAVANAAAGASSVHNKPGITRAPGSAGSQSCSAAAVNEGCRAVAPHPCTAGPSSSCSDT
jgi:hypothetical protein